MKLARMFLIVVAAILLLAPPESQSCGPFLPEAQFVFRLGPVDELPYYQGKLGIVQPTYRRRNLIVAYRKPSRSSTASTGRRRTENG